MDGLFFAFLALSPIGLLIGLIWPSGLSKLIKKPVSRKQASLFFIVLMIVSFVGLVSTMDSETPIDTAQVQEEFVPSLNVVVSSQIIKKVDGQYRYFFDIRNKDTRNFSGEVTIKLYKEGGTYALGENSFESRAPMEPELGTSVYIDISTGPASEHGDSGITKFTYEVRIGDKIVNKGEGEITSEFEDSDLYRNF